MISRRDFLKMASFFAGSLLIGCSGSNTSYGDEQWFMPDENAPHRRTWMAFGASSRIWGDWLLPEVQRNLATIAQTIARYEPVSMLVRENEYDLAHELVGSSVELIISPLDDLWMRDTGPIFVSTEQGQQTTVDFNFNGWGNKQTHQQDTKVAAFVAQQAGIPVINTDLVLEGGRSRGGFN